MLFILTVIYSDIFACMYYVWWLAVDKKRLCGLIGKCIFTRGGRLFLPREFYDILEDLIRFSRVL